MASRTILITGASGGLGASLARGFAAPDTRLVLWGRDADRLAQTAAACRALGCDCITDAFDIRDADGQLARLAAIGTLDIAIFNAGLGGTVPDVLLSEDAERARATAEVNFVAPVIGASMIAGEMAKRGGGQIVLIGSIAESFPLPMAPTYAATKAGLAMFADALSVRMQKHNVAVTLVSPGFVDTPMSRQVTDPKPFLISSDAAARVIIRGVTARKRRIVVPWQYIFLRGLVVLLPRPLLHALLSRALART